MTFVPVPEETAGTLCRDTHPGAYTGQDAYQGKLVPEVLAFDPTQVTHPANRSTPRGDSTQALASTARPPHLAYSVWPGRPPEAELRAREIDVAPALTSTAEANSTNRGVRVVCATGAVTHALTRGASDGATEDGTGRGTPVVPVAYQCQGTNVGEMGTLRSGNGHLTGGVPFTLEVRGRNGERQLEYLQDGTANCLRVSNGGRDGMGVGAVAAPMPEWRVRRLTPMECERLQGFPDGWTAIPGAKDGPRYAALGNSMAVPVMRWIGQRIAAVDAILKKAKK